MKQSYDISCQYLINFLRRLDKWRKLCPTLPSIKSITLPRIEGYVGCWHVNAHKPECRVKQSPEFHPGAGGYEGEGMERVWSGTNDLSLRTKEMTPGHRQDVLNDQYSDLNVRRIHDLGMYNYGCVFERTRADVVRTGRSLCARLKDATKLLSDMTEALTKVEEKIPIELLNVWRADEAEWMAKVVDISNHGELDNPYSPPADAGKSFSLP